MFKFSNCAPWQGAVSAGILIASIIDVKELRSEDKDNSSDKNMDDDDGFNHDIKWFSLVRKEKAT